MRYHDILGNLRAAYDGGAEERDRRKKQPWKVAERAGFLERLAQGARLLEVGAGTGQDSLFFIAHGLEVVATDLSPVMVERCRAKGIDARAMDVLNLDFPAASFDAVYSINCLLHVPDADLPAVLERICAVLRPGGLFYFGAYGGSGEEGIAEQDTHHPPRFFSWRTDAQARQLVGQSFRIVDFHVIESGDYHFQSLTAQRPEVGPG
ncbi:MAG TPA: class I SAM-dependent methyltransferase [Streptosporangiaceae bacterium]|nr:class I SAM-dependent methyltransferase [Streptosporangiaceae bacterium]